MSPDIFQLSCKYQQLSVEVLNHSFRVWKLLSTSSRFAYYTVRSLSLSPLSLSSLTLSLISLSWGRGLIFYSLISSTTHIFNYIMCYNMYYTLTAFYFFKYNSNRSLRQLRLCNKEYVNYSEICSWRTYTEGYDNLHSFVHELQ